MKTFSQTIKIHREAPLRFGSESSGHWAHKGRKGKEGGSKPRRSGYGDPSKGEIVDWYSAEKKRIAKEYLPKYEHAHAHERPLVLFEWEREEKEAQKSFLAQLAQYLRLKDAEPSSGYITTNPVIPHGEYYHPSVGWY